MHINSRNDFPEFNMHDLTRSFCNGSNSHQPCVSLSPVIASEHRRYIYECGGKHFFTTKRTCKSIECLVVDEGVRVIRRVF